MKDLIIVIQCAAGKQENAGHLRTSDEQDVMFVAKPHDAPRSENLVYAHPDGMYDTKKRKSWRTKLEEYNEEYKVSGGNPRKLLPAGQLYKNSTYGILDRRFGTKQVYILSAGWGLIKADFLTPDYDITFSKAKNVELYKRRGPQEEYEDFNHLPSDVAESLVFFGTPNYIDLFCRLTEGAKGKRMVFWKGKNKPDAPGCMLREYKTTLRTNWHYECAKKFAEGCLPGFDRILADLGCDS